MAAKSAAGIAQKARIFDSRCTNDDVTQATVDVLLDGVEVANTAAQLNGNVVAHFFEDGLDGRKVLRFASKGTIQIDQMQTTCAFFEPGSGHGSGVLTESGGLVHVALFEANAVAVFEINRGYQNHGELVALEWIEKSEKEIKVASVRSFCKAPILGQRFFRGETE